MMMEISDVQGPELGSDLYPGNDNGPRMSERSSFTAYYLLPVLLCSHLGSDGFVDGFWISIQMVLSMELGFRVGWFLSWLLEMILFDFMLTDILWQV